MNQIVIRDATMADLQVINDIYNYYVENCTCTWSLEKVTMEARRDWFAGHLGHLPVLVAERNGEALGWAALSAFRSFEGYRHTAEDSIYVRHDAQGRGLGRRLLEALLERAKPAGLHTIVAVISGEQEASIALHAKLGFVKAGQLIEAGRKFDRWLDVVFMQKMIP